MNARSLPGLAWFNSAAESDVRAALHDICASRAWGNALLARRPWADVPELCAASDTATAALTADDLAEAMAAHPPIGRPDPGDPTSSREQRGMAEAAGEIRASMPALNLAYQEKFGHVFLVCAAGKSGEEMREALLNRIGNSPEQERESVRRELTQINRLRLQAMAETEKGKRPA